MSKTSGKVHAWSTGAYTTFCGQPEGRVSRTSSFSHVTCAHCIKILEAMRPDQLTQEKFIRFNAEIYVRGKGEDLRLYRIFMVDPMWRNKPEEMKVLERYAEDIIDTLNENRL